MIDLLQKELLELREQYGYDRSALLPVLQELDKRYPYLDPAIINEIARAFSLSQTDVYSTASFYHFLNIRPCGKYVIRLCATVSCEVSGKERIIRALESELGIKMGQTSPDGLYTLSYANCMGMCDRGPAMLVNNDLYADLTPSRALDIVRSYHP